MSETTPTYQTALLCRICGQSTAENVNGVCQKCWEAGKHLKAETALDNLVHQRRTDASVARQANAAMYEILLSETANLLHGTESLTQAVLHQICVEHNSRPNDVLSLVHDFLAAFQAYQQHEQAPEQPAEAKESPFLGREA